MQGGQGAERALEAAKDAAYAEGQASMKPWAEKKAERAKAKADKEKEAALKRKDEEWSGKVNTLETDVKAARDHLSEMVEERDAMAAEVDALRSENGKLRERVSVLQRVVDFVREKAPEPVRKIIDALTRQQEPAPLGEGAAIGLPDKKTPSPF